MAYKFCQLEFAHPVDDIYSIDNNQMVKRYKSMKRRTVVSQINDKKPKTDIEAVAARQGGFSGENLDIYIRGPFGAPASDFYQAQHAVLVCTGIGVTPFSSILQSINFR